MTADTTPAVPVVPRGPGHCDDDAAWAEFVRQYDGQPRSRPDMTDFALANAVFMVDRNSLDLMIYQTAAKERIRWLSIELAKAMAAAPVRLAGAVDDFLPKNVAFDNPNIPDELVVPFDVTMGEIRRLREAFAITPKGGEAELLSDPQQLDRAEPVTDPYTLDGA